jgi:hypothetical protein
MKTRSIFASSGSNFKRSKNNQMKKINPNKIAKTNHLPGKVQKAQLFCFLGTATAVKLALRRVKVNYKQNHLQT